VVATEDRRTTAQQLCDIITGFYRAGVVEPAATQRSLAGETVPAAHHAFRIGQGFGRQTPIPSTTHRRIETFDELV
jgi:hypothetical protein